MILYRDWTITSSGLLARQYDNLSRRVEVIGDLPAGWEWDLIVKVEGAMDVIPLEPMDGGVGHTLTKDQVSIAGYYSVQLRGRQGETVKHTNVIQVFVPASLSGDGQWPTLPSEFTEMEQRLWELNDHPPTPGKNGFWQIWDPDKDEYVDSDIPFAGSGGGSVTGDYIPVPAFAEVGQTIRVSAVDENGKPIKWEAVDMAGGGNWRYLGKFTTEEDVASMDIFADADGKPFRLKKIRFRGVIAPNALGNEGWIKLINNKNLNIPSVPVSYGCAPGNNVVGKSFITEFEIVDGLLASVTIATSQNSTNAWNVLTNAYTFDVIQDFAVDAFTEIILRGYQPGIFGAGSYVEVWGVDA